LIERLERKDKSLMPLSHRRFIRKNHLPRMIASTLTMVVKRNATLKYSACYSVKKKLELLEVKLERPLKLTQVSRRS
jgi:hypothetical protein